MAPHAVICALNEAPTIGSVIDAVLGSGAISSVLVVDDGSTDGTTDVARAHGASVLRFHENQGKGEALRAGFASVPGDPVAMFDADLLGLRPDHVRSLVAPAEVYEMVCGLRDHGGLLGVGTLMMPIITGERIVSRRILSAVADTCWSGYAIETAMNDAARRLGANVACIPMTGVGIRNKTRKVGLLDGTIRNLKMLGQIWGTSSRLRRSCGTSCAR